MKRKEAKKKGGGRTGRGNYLVLGADSEDGIASHEESNGNQESVPFPVLWIRPPAS